MATRAPAASSEGPARVDGNLLPALPPPHRPDGDRGGAASEHTATLHDSPPREMKSGLSPPLAAGGGGGGVDALLALAACGETGELSSSSGSSSTRAGARGSVTVAEGDRKRRRIDGSGVRGVNFGEVTVLEHAPQLAEDKLATTGPSVGLGALQHVTIHRVDSYDLRREGERTGVRHLDASERRQTLLSIRRAESIDAEEMESEVLRRQREQSANEPISPTMTQPPPGARLFAPIQAAASGPLGLVSMCSGTASERDDEVGISDLFF